MEWHEVIAWVVIIAAVIATAVWFVRRIVYPESRCEGCGKSCALRRKTKDKNN